MADSRKTINGGSNGSKGNSSRPSGRKPGSTRQRSEGRSAGSGRSVSRAVNAKPSGGKAAGRKKAKKTRNKILLFIFEIVVLVLLVMFMWFFVFNIEKSGKINIKEEDIVINETVKEHAATAMKGYRNIALFGVDSTSGALGKGTRSDSIMIASINLDTGECKLVSVYRDTYLNLGNDTYSKSNAAYAKGGPEQAINMLNMNLDMNITDFVTVGFRGLSDTIDALGGIMIDVDESEISHLNNYQKTMAEDLKRSYTPLANAGYQQLDGLQATAYCRIRYTKGDDFKRAERQREVLMAVADKAKTASPATLGIIAGDVFESVYTSLDLEEIISLLGDVAKYQITDNAGFPEETRRLTGTIGAAGSCVVPVSLEENVQWLHQFLFDVSDYQPSSEVKTYSQKINSDTSKYVK